MTLGVVARIHWQAVKLWRRRVPFFRQTRAANPLREPMNRSMPEPRRLPSGHDVERTPSATTNVPAAARAVLRLLERLRHGSLELRLPDGTSARFGSRAAGEPHAAMRLANWNVFGAALKAGDIGVAESYIAGDWTSPDLPALLSLFIANRDAIESVVYGSWWGSLLHRLRHFANRNSRRGSRKNIQAHYDLGNAFYRLWLDPTMSYSSAWFEGDRSADLVKAQWAKTRRALTECRVKPGDRVLEIGCGWGALAECAARDFGATVHWCHLVGRAARLGPRAPRRRPAAKPAASCATTATSTAAATTRSHRSRCSRRSGANTGPASSPSCAIG